MSEFTSEIKTDSSYINGNTFNLKKVKYSIINGLAIFEGDIILGTVDEMNKNKRLADVQKVVAISGADYRWPQLLIPFSIEDGFPNAVRITNAINHWQTNTPAMFIERTSANASSHPNYILFKKGTNCSSKVGMQGGPQELIFTDGCSMGSVIHEIGHAVGLWHEQSREDRDAFIDINWDNIIEEYKHNFEQHITESSLLFFFRL